MGQRPRAPTTMDATMPTNRMDQYAGNRFLAEDEPGRKETTMPDPKWCPKCEGSGTLDAIVCDDEDMTLTVACPACSESTQSPRYLAVYGAMVAMQITLDENEQPPGQETMRAIVTLAHDVAKRSEEAQP